MRLNLLQSVYILFPFMLLCNYFFFIVSVFYTKVSSSSMVQISTALYELTAFKVARCVAQALSEMMYCSKELKENRTVSHISQC